MTHKFSLEITIGSYSLHLFVRTEACRMSATCDSYDLTITDLLDKHLSLCWWLLHMVMFCNYKTGNVNFNILSFWTSVMEHLNLSFLNTNCHHCWLCVMNLVPCHTCTTLNILTFARPEVFTAVTEDYKSTFLGLSRRCKHKVPLNLWYLYTHLHSVIS